MTQSQSDILGNLWGTVSDSQEFITEFESVYNHTEVVAKYKLIKGAYIFSIVISLGKIFADDSWTEPFSLNRFSKAFPELKDEINNIFESYKETIGKIRGNRHNIFAHTANFIGMGFSKQAVTILTEAHGTDYSRYLANSKENERYTPEDLLADIPEIKTALAKVKNILDKVLMK